MAISDDRLLGGRVILRQPREGYRAAVDPVLLAAATPVAPGEKALDLGCGVGAAGLCLLARIPELTIVGVEIDAELARLAAENGVANGYETMRFDVRCGDVAALGGLPQDFDHVVMNPPFHDSRGTPSPHARRSVATHGGDDLPLWVDVAHRRLRHRGALTMIWPSARLSIAVSAVTARFGSLRLSPIWPREGVPAKRVILSAVKGGRAPERLSPGLVLHGSGTSYSAEAQAILRDAAPLDWKDGA